MNNTRKSVLNIVTGVGGQLITIVIGILLPRLFISNYGSETNGFLSSINSLLSYLSLLEAGVGAATVQALYGPIGRRDRDKINGVLSATNHFYKRTGIVYAVFIAAIALLYPLVVPSKLSYPLQFGIILLVGLTGVLGYLFQAKYKLLLQAEGKQYVITNITTSIHLFTSIGKLVLISLRLSIIFLQVLQLCLVVVQIVFYYAYIKKYYPWINLRTKPDEKAIAQKNNVIVHQVAEMVFNHTDVVLLTLIVGDLKIVSVYTLYNMLVDMVSTMIGNVNSGFVFRLGQLYNTNRDKHNLIFDTYETYYMAFSFSMYAVTYMFLHPFMKLYTEGVTDVNYLLPLLPLLFVTYKLLVCGRAACGGLSSYAGHFKQTQMHSIIESAINLIVSVIAVYLCQKKWRLGIYGVLIGTIAALLYRANIMILYANREILKRSSFRTYGKWILNFILTVIVCLLFSLWKPEMNNYISLILHAAVSAITVLAVYVIVNSIIYRQNSSLLLGILKRD